MPVLLTIGPVHALTAGVTYTAPARRCLGVTDTAGLEGSIDGSVWNALVLAADNSFQTSYPFVRSPGGAANVRYSVG